MGTFRALIRQLATLKSPTLSPLLKRLWATPTVCKSVAVRQHEVLQSRRRWTQLTSLIGMGSIAKASDAFNAARFVSSSDSMNAWMERTQSEPATWRVSYPCCPSHAQCSARCSTRGGGTDRGGHRHPCEALGHPIVEQADNMLLDVHEHPVQSRGTLRGDLCGHHSRPV